jgi:hypothetical protein
MSMIILRKTLILRSARRVRLEGRTVLLQRPNLGLLA